MTEERSNLVSATLVLPDGWSDLTLLEAIVQHHPDMIFVKEAAELRFVLCNRAHERLLGWSSQEMMGKTDYDFYPREQADFYVARDREALTKKVLVETVEMNTSRLGTRWFRTKKVALDGPDGRPRYVLGIAEDITEQKEAKERLDRISALLVGSDDEQPESTSPAMRQVVAAANTVAREDHVSVLLLGETGVGKSWFARHIHRHSTRAPKPFIEVNCASLKPDLVESELFGHERGAFTGATVQKIGLVEAAEGGTLFLDEVADLPLSVQAQVLTFLDHRHFRRVGGVRDLEADVRIIAATNADLNERIEQHAFRADLGYRLSVFPLTIPPLRERASDLLELARSQVQEISARRRQPPPPFAEDAIAALVGYAWPGNVRELRNVLERALIVDTDQRLGADDLGPLGGRTKAPTSLVPLADVEWAHIEAVLEAVSGNRTTAASLLGISRSTLKRKLADRPKRRRSVAKKRPQAR